MTIVRCPICNIKFKMYGKQKRKYCSVNCMKIGYKEQLKGKNNPNYKHGPKKCINCGKTIRSHSKNKCKDCYYKILVGEGNPFYGKHHSKEIILKWGKERKGRPGYFKGKKHSEENKKLQSERKKNEWKNKTDEEKLGSGSVSICEEKAKVGWKSKRLGRNSTVACRSRSVPLSAHEGRASGSGRALGIHSAQLPMPGQPRHSMANPARVWLEDRF